MTKFLDLTSKPWHQNSGEKWLTTPSKNPTTSGVLMSGFFEELPLNFKMNFCRLRIGWTAPNFSSEMPNNTLEFVRHSKFLPFIGIKSEPYQYPRYHHTISTRSFKGFSTFNHYMDHIRGVFNYSTNICVYESSTKFFSDI